jgi:hypothetical protein
MEIEIFGQLGNHLARKQQKTYSQIITITELVNDLGLDIERVGLITINGVQLEPHSLITNEDRVCFFPFLSGG